MSGDILDGKELHPQDGHNSENNFFNEVLKSSFKDVKSFYSKILMVLIPYWIFLLVVNFSLLAIEKDVATKFIEYSFSFIRLTLSEFIFLICLYKIKSLIQSTDDNIYLEISYNLFDLIKIVIKRAVLVNLGYMFLIIPGIYISIRWFLTYPIYVFEQAGDPFNRSEKLAKNHYFNIFSIMALFWISVLIVFLIITILSIIIMGVILDIEPSIKRNAFLVIISVLLLLASPVHGILEYESYKWLKAHYKERFDDIKPKFLKLR